MLVTRAARYIVLASTSQKVGLNYRLYIVLRFVTVPKQVQIIQTQETITFIA